jgi:hypothetical protein
VPGRRSISSLMPKPPSPTKRRRKALSFAVRSLVYTSVDDVKSALPLRNNTADLELAASLNDAEGNKTKATLIRARIRQLRKEQT